MLAFATALFVALPQGADAPLPPPLSLRIAATPGSTEALVQLAPPQALVAVVLGTRAGTLLLPGGLSLAVAPEVVAGIAFADAGGQAFLIAHVPVGSAAGLRFLAQAIALDPTRAAHAPGAIAVSAVHHVAVPAPGADADVYLLFGQSNAEGSATTAALPAGLQAPQPHGRIWNDTAGAWQALQPGTNGTTLVAFGRCGPETTLLDGLTGDDRTVHLLKFAVTQASLGPSPGPWNEWNPAADELYGELLRRLDRACSRLRAHGLRPVVRGICMMQGETDAIDATLAGIYGERLVHLVGHLRGRLAQRGLATDATRPIPFVCGLVSPRLPAAVFAHTHAVRLAQRQAAGMLPATAVVETSRLTLQADRVHFDTAGVAGLGAMMAQSLRLLGAR
jgi:hypothetical protein